MGKCVLGNKGQNYGNKGDGDYAEHLKNDAGKLRTARMTVNSPFQEYSYFRKGVCKKHSVTLTAGREYSAPTAGCQRAHRRQ